MNPNVNEVTQTIKTAILLARELLYLQVSTSCVIITPYFCFYNMDNRHFTWKINWLKMIKLNLDYKYLMHVTVWKILAYRELMTNADFYSFHILTKGSGFGLLIAIFFLSVEANTPERLCVYFLFLCWDKTLSQYSWNT